MNLYEHFMKMSGQRIAAHYDAWAKAASDPNYPVDIKEDAEVILDTLREVMKIKGPDAPGEEH